MLNYFYKLKFKNICVFIVTFSLCHLIFEVFFFLNIEDEVRSLPVLIWWTKFTRVHKDRSISCTNEAYKCLISTNRSHNTAAYLFYGSRIENHDFPLPRNYKIPWAVLHEESPKNYAPFLFKEMQKIFNLTSTFSRYSDFPITLQYLEDVTLITDLKYYVPVDVKNKYLDDIAPVLYIQSDCDTPISRDFFVKQLGKFVKIDSYGECLTNKKFPKELSEIYSLDVYNEELLRFISKYKFIIAFENSICDDYITEKLWRPLIVGSIPVYFGAPTIKDWLPNNNSAILVKDCSNPEDLANVIKKINADDTLYESFLEHKVRKEISNHLLKEKILTDHPIPAFECFVCERMHSDNIYERTNNDLNVYKCPKPNTPEEDNTWYQHWDVGECQSKALEVLLAKNAPYSPDLFESTWKTLLYNKNC